MEQNKITLKEYLEINNNTFVEKNEEEKSYTIKREVYFDTYEKFKIDDKGTLYRSIMEAPLDFGVVYANNFGRELRSDDYLSWYDIMAVDGIQRHIYGLQKIVREDVPKGLGVREGTIIEMC